MSRIKGSHLLCALLSALLAWDPALGQAPSSDQPEDGRQRVHTLFRHSRDATEGERITFVAFGEEANRLVLQVRSARDETTIQRLAELLLRQEISEATRERVFLEVARALAPIGTPASLTLLDDLAGRTPTVVAPVPGCFAPVQVAVFDYPPACRLAEFRIRERDELSQYRRLEPAAQMRWLLETSDSERGSPRLRAAQSAIRDLPENQRTPLREDLLMSRRPLTPAAGELLVEIYLADAVVPEVEEFVLLSGSAARRLVEVASRADATIDRIAVWDIARHHPRVASLAAHLDQERGIRNPREYLAHDGASAAAVLSRDRSPERTRELAAVLADAEAAERLRRHAALALIHQDTEAAWETLRAVVSAGDLPAAISRKLERWFER